MTKAEVKATAEVIDNAEDLMQEAKRFMKEPSEYGEEVRLLGYRIETLRSAASSARAIRYDRERVQGGMPYGMADMVLDLIDMESEFDNVRCWYKIINNDVKKLLYKALDKQSADVWFECYVKGYSRSAVAFRHGITKRQVQWLLEKKQNVVAVLLAINEWREGVEYYD